MVREKDTEEERSSDNGQREGHKKRKDIRELAGKSNWKENTRRKEDDERMMRTQRKEWTQRMGEDEDRGREVIR